MTFNLSIASGLQRVSTQELPENMSMIVFADTFTYPYETAGARIHFPFPARTWQLGGAEPHMKIPNSSAKKENGS